MLWDTPMVVHKRDAYVSSWHSIASTDRSFLALAWTVEYNAKREGDGIPMTASNSKEARRREGNNAVVKMKVGRNIKREAVCGEQ
jgi:hypothetical protein